MTVPSPLTPQPLHTDMKTNKTGKQNPLFLYVDKIIFAVLVLVALYYCYSAVSLEKISWTPEQLTSDSTLAQQNIDNSTHRVDLKITEYETRARDIRSGFPHKYYQTTEKWEAAVFPERIMRKNPKIMPLIKLRAVAGVGAVMVRDRESVFGATTSPGMAGSTMGGIGAGTSSPMGGMGMSSSGMGMGGAGAAGSKVETKHWVLLTGLIPYEDQLREYVRTFANAQYASPNDYPIYLFVEIERNEIGVNNADGTPVWVKLDVDSTFAEQRTKWAGTGMDPVDMMSYTLPPLFHPTASPLPPLANRLFGHEVAYPPFIPLMADSLREQMKQQLDSQLKMLENRRDVRIEDIMNDQDNKFQLFPTGASGTGGGMGGMSSMGSMSSGGMGGNAASAISAMFNPGGGGGMGRTGGMSGMGGSSGGMSMGGMGSEYGGGMSGSMSGMSSSMGGMSGSMGGMGGSAASNPWVTFTKTLPTVMVEAKYRLFRYFDFSVDPGKSYQYRVKLAVYNPNFRLAIRFLDNDAAKDRLVMPVWSEFSNPSGPVAVNSNARIIAKSVGSIPRNTWLPQNATVSSIVFDTSDNEDYIAKDINNISQGMVLNFPRKGGEKVSSLTSASGMYGMSGGSTSMGGSSPGMPGMPGAPTGRGAQPQAKATTKTLDHISGECVLDVTGSRRLIGTNNEHTPAGHVMLMAFDGTIQIQSIKTNKLELDRYEKPVATTTGMGSSGMSMP